MEKVLEIAWDYYYITADITTQEIVELIRESRAGV